MKRTFIWLITLMLLLTACTTSPLPTPVQTTPATTPQPSPLLGTKWKLDRMVVNGETRTTFEFSHHLEFTWDNELWTDYGCNTIMVPVTTTIPNRNLEFAPTHRITALACYAVDTKTGKTDETSPMPVDNVYVDAVFDSVAYDLRNNELWLFYPDDKTNMLIYKLVEKMPPPGDQSEPAVITPMAVQVAAPTSGLALALINGTLIDGTGTDPIKDAVLIIQGERIVAVGPRNSIDIPEGAEIIDVQGATILPGFFNAHVHGAYDEEKLAAWAKEGVTTVRDLGAHQWPPSQALLDRVEKDNRYARLISGGIFITPPGDYSIAKFGGNGKTISTTEEAPLAVSEMLDEGADLIKISLESGQIFRLDIPMLTTEQVKAIVATARQRGTRVSAHATVTKDLKRAIDEGIDDVAHMVVDPLSDDLIKAMIDRDMYWVPTLELWKNVGQGQDTNVIDNLKRYVAAGGNVALGTDFEGYYTPFQLGMPTKEIGWLREAGMMPMQIIVAATKNAAHVSNVEQDLGTLEIGKIADVLIVNGDPLQDLTVLSQVLYVIHNGEVIRKP